MADQVSYVAVDWSSGWLHFLIMPNNTLQPSGFAVKKDQTLTDSANLSSGDYPPGFTIDDQNQLINLCAKLAAEWSKAAINATQVVLVGQVFYEVGYEPAP